MITKEQIERFYSEVAANASAALVTARNAELNLEAYTYTTERPYDLEKRQRLLEEFNDADYQAESLAWSLSLIKSAKNCG